MTKFFGASSFAVAVALFAGPVGAQTAPDAGGEPASGSQERPDTQADAGDGLAEIIVTAQKRSQNLQEVPVAISVISSELLKDSGFNSLSDLAYLAPSVQHDPSNGGGFQIRGIGTQVFDYSTEQAVGVVIDDVVMDLPRSPGILGLSDIERIEVLRGPQGTLFGKNASGGVISVVTKKPSTEKVEGDATVRYGERNDRQLSANLNLPLGRDAALRISGFHQGQDGYGRYTFLGKKLGSFRETGVRAKLLIRPLDGLELTLAGDYARHRDNSAFTLVTASGLFEPALSASGVVPGPRNVDNADPIESGSRYTVKGGSLVINYELADHVLTAITAYRKFDFENDAPFDFVPSPLFLPINHGVVNSRKFSQEFRVSSPRGQFIEYVLGLYYNDMKLYSTQEQAGQLGAPLPPNLYLSLSNGETVFNNRIRSKAIFGTATVNLSEQLAVVLGGRFTDDKNSASIAYRDVQRPYAYIPIATLPASPSGSVSKSNFSYRVSPQFKFDSNNMIYATYATGYKGPGVSFFGSVRNIYRPETVRSFELGAKTELFDRMLRLNLAIFHEKFSDFQTQAQIVVNGVPTFVLNNAGGLRSRGAELEFNLRASKAISLSGGVTYADSEFTDYLKGAVQLAGNRLTNAPRWSWTLAANLDQPIGDRYALTAAVNYSWRSKVFTLVADPSSQVGSYGLLGARIGFGDADGSWRIGAYARNLTDTQFSTGFLGVPGVLFARTFSSDGRRTLGAFAELRF